MKKWCVIGINDGEKIIFIEMYPIDAIRLPDFVNSIHKLSIVAFENRKDALKFYLEVCKMNNFSYDFSLSKRGPIECITTGQIYPSAIDCATTEGIATSALSNHLNGRPSFKTIKGKTYRRLSQKFV